MEKYSNLLKGINTFKRKNIYLLSTNNVASVLGMYAMHQWQRELKFIECKQ